MTEPDRTADPSATPASRPGMPDDAAEPSSPKPHGDPLLDSAQGRGDGDDASRHGRPADAAAQESTG
ncbi:MAG: hypothetical protein M3P93_02175 [Actinomycetota bacterium]|nr:hypothetical protein [Actinomycetota bacterium]